MFSVYFVTTKLTGAIKNYRRPEVGVKMSLMEMDFFSRWLLSSERYFIKCPGEEDYPPMNESCRPIIIAEMSQCKYPCDCYFWPIALWLKVNTNSGVKFFF